MTARMITNPSRSGTVVLSKHLRSLVSSLLSHLFSPALHLLTVYQAVSIVGYLRRAQTLVTKTVLYLHLQTEAAVVFDPSLKVDSF